MVFDGLFCEGIDKFEIFIICKSLFLFFIWLVIDIDIFFWIGGLFDFLGYLFGFFFGGLDVIIFMVFFRISIIFGCGFGCW